MVSACAFGTLLEHPSSSVREAIPDGFARRVFMGCAMGLTAVGLIFSPWGKRSGAHMNPATTLTFFRLGKVKPWDAFFYVVAQFIGGLAGVLVCAALFGQLLAHRSVGYVATLPGAHGAGIAFLAEVVMTFVLMSVILRASNTPRLGRYTGIFAGALVAVYIIFEAPISGMSLNPARTLGSALPAQVWTSLWIYFIAPPLGMLAAAEWYVRQRGIQKVFCAKLHHHNSQRCIFRCDFASLEKPNPQPAVAAVSDRSQRQGPVDRQSQTAATAQPTEN